MEQLPEDLVVGLRELLVDWNEGDTAALHEIMPLVYDQLRRQAARRLATEPSDISLQATDLVHELYLRLQKRRGKHWTGEAHFLAVCTLTLHYLIVEHMRRRRRHGQKTTITTSFGHEQPAVDIDMLALDTALKKLASQNRQASLVFLLRTYELMTLSQTADALGVSVSTVQRRSTYATMWLTRELTQRSGHGG